MLRHGKRRRVKESPYTVLVRDLPTRRTFEVDSAQVAEWLRGLPMRDALEAPELDAGEGRAELELYADGAHAFAAGSFTGHVTVACSRCIAAVKLPIDERLRVTFMPSAEIGDAGEAEPESEDGVLVAADDVDVFPFDGERIDLEPLLREQFVLAVPYAPLCSETCKGLCAQCGIDLNTGTCACEKPIDPRLAVLKGLKLPT
jgi:uncharacterized protein